MDTITIIDLETTGLDPNVHEVIEFAAILYDLNDVCIVAQASYLFPVKANYAYNINGIKEETTRHGAFIRSGHDYVMDLIDYSDVLVAHNISFDKSWFNGKTLPKVSDKIWLCTQKDFIYTPEFDNYKLTTIADAHGIGINNAHRALDDCRLIADIINSYIDPKKVISLALEK